MASTTNNGWPKDPAVVRVYVGNDTDGAEFAVGDPAVIFEHVFWRIHNEVEPVRKLNGFRSSAYNDSINGSVPSSNHVSGTAGDWNGDVHPNELAAPRGLKPSGLNAAQTAQLRQILADVVVVKWGADFPVGTRDYMHLELMGTRAQVRTIADRIRALPRPGPTPEPAEIVPEPPKDDTMKLVRVAEDLRIFLIGELSAEQVPDYPTYTALAVLYGPFVDRPIVEVARIVDQVGRNRAAFAAAVQLPAIKTNTDLLKAGVATVDAHVGTVQSGVTELLGRP